jgi:Txe/YoeB family toxin of Txe-Axe toxin-antitoxin module
LDISHAVFRDQPEPLRKAFIKPMVSPQTQDRRLVYQVSEDALLIAQCRYHN